MYLWRGILSGLTGNLQAAIADADSFEPNPEGESVFASVDVSADYVKHYLVAFAYLQHGDLDNAIEQMSSYLNLIPPNADLTAINPNRAVVLTERARLYAKKSDFDAAMNDLAEAIKLSPNYGGAYAVRAEMVYMPQGRSEEAAREPAKASELSKDPLNDGFVSMQRGNFRMRSSNFATRDRVHAGGHR